MFKFIIPILIGIILFLIGIVINITENFSSDVSWVGIGFLVSGMFIIVFASIGKTKPWF